jgi:hypothetical protein
MARGIVLPGEANKRRTGRLASSGLIVPSAVAEENNPHFRCRVCGRHEWTVREETSFTRHVLRCAEDNGERLHELSLRTRNGGETMHGDNHSEADREAWVREHREEILEGRKTIYGKDDPWTRAAKSS